MKANLCKCNNCGTVMIDQNPQFGAVEHELTGNEVEMQYLEVEHRERIWVCPVCMVDDYLIDL